MPVFYDQLNRPVNIPAMPQRIISVVPSQTELLFALGVFNELVGVTNYCVHPIEQVATKIKVGGTKTLNVNLIKNLRPDLIIANKEENDREQINYLAKLYPVWISNVNDLPGALKMIGAIGSITGFEKESATLTARIVDQFEKIHIPARRLKTMYLIWRKPYMAAGNDTFISSMLHECGFINALTEPRYPVLSSEELSDLDPDLVLLSSEPYPFKEKHIMEIKKIVPRAIVAMVDGEIFSWYGSRLLYAPDYFVRLRQTLKI
ncbi:cobalamin-binding protein [Mucilaginibacter hurinus]|uniref:Cobalamin-binding protein n=1 Tax=Mucilaginibacter hurinus TaxID=2201324 RepID=A0A367GR40_9SPHI|nr:helical backbone metal receptor [Mucilaginibacter hurinus]RCH55912.1 cobalamin-binding protein [Mucilaginibacter hurinus]